MSIIDNLRENGGLPTIKNRRVFLMVATGNMIPVKEGSEDLKPELVKSEAWIEILPPQSTEFLKAFERSNIRQVIANKKIDAVKESEDIDAISAALEYAKGINRDILDEIVVNWSEHFGVPCTKENKIELFSNPASSDIIAQILSAFQEVDSFMGK